MMNNSSYCKLKESKRNPTPLGNRLFINHRNIARVHSAGCLPVSSLNRLPEHPAVQSLDENLLPFVSEQALETTTHPHRSNTGIQD